MLFNTAAKSLQIHPYDPREDEMVFADESSDDESDTEDSATTDSDNEEDGNEDSSNDAESTPVAPEEVTPQGPDAATKKPQENEFRPQLKFFASRELGPRPFELINEFRWRSTEL